MSGADPAARLGFGCASVFGLPTARERRAVLEAAHDLGIRHFDVAPIYGLGLAEGELGQFRRAHPDVVVATKFGLGLTPVGRLAGRVQGPVRRGLRRASSLRRRVKESGGSPSAGTVGSVLYRELGYSPEVALQGLERSLQRLGTTQPIDYFLLHEPAPVLPRDAEPLIATLERERDRGRIRAWGPAGELPDPGVHSELYERADVVQHPYQWGEQPDGAAGRDGASRILFGFLSRSLGPMARRVADDAQLRARLDELVGRPVDPTRDLPGVLLRDAVRAAGPEGRVLLSTTKPAHLRALVEALEHELPREADLLQALHAATLRRSA